jgi:hypothetical protein
MTPGHRPNTDDLGGAFRAFHFTLRSTTRGRPAFHASADAAYSGSLTIGNGSLSRHRQPKAERYAATYSFFSHVPIHINARKTAGGSGGMPCPSCAATAPPRYAEIKSNPKGRVLGTRKTTALANSSTATIMSFGPEKPSAVICVTIAGTCANFVNALAKSAMLGRKIRILLEILRNFGSPVAVVIVSPSLSGLPPANRTAFVFTPSRRTSRRGSRWLFGP